MEGTPEVVLRGLVPFQADSYRLLSKKDLHPLRI
jgi:hypothetical protein